VLAALIAAAPEWAEQFSPEASASARPLDEALVAALRAVAAERPVMLAIDDVGCLDTESLLQLPRMLRGIGSFPLVLVMVARLGDVRNEIDGLRGQVNHVYSGLHVAVEPLRDAELFQAVQEVLPAWNPEAQDRLTRRLIAESAGLPAVAIGILEAVVRGLALEELDGTWPVPDHTMDATLPSPMPGTLTAATRMRFHQLDDLDRQLLNLIAVEGSTIRADRLCRLTGQEAEEVDRHLDALESERWVVADSRGYRYRVRAVGTLVAAELMTPGQRRRIEARLAEN
jgi:predicted ATPase